MYRYYWKKKKTGCKEYVYTLRRETFLNSLKLVLHTRLGHKTGKARKTEEYLWELAWQSRQSAWT